MFFFLRGKVLNLSQEYDNRAVECLSKAVKLDPNLINAWNELGECYWKNKDIDAAFNCFTQANTKVKLFNCYFSQNILIVIRFFKYIFTVMKKELNIQW